jgi:hypothetical protein
MGCPYPFMILWVIKNHHVIMHTYHLLRPDNPTLALKLAVLLM